MQLAPVKVSPSKWGKLVLLDNVVRLEEDLAGLSQRIDYDTETAISAAKGQGFVPALENGWCESHIRQEQVGVFPALSESHPDRFDFPSASDPGNIHGIQHEVDGEFPVDAGVADHVATPFRDIVGGNALVGIEQGSVVIDTQETRDLGRR